MLSRQDANTRRGRDGLLAVIQGHEQESACISSSANVEMYALPFSRRAAVPQSMAPNLARRKSAAVLSLRQPLFLNVFRLQFLQQFPRCQTPAGKSRMVEGVPIRTKERRSTWRTSARPAPAARCGLPERHQLLFLRVRQQGFDLGIDLFLNLRQSFPLLGRKPEPILLRRGQNSGCLAERRCSWRRSWLPKHPLDLLALRRRKQPIEPSSHCLLESSQVLFLFIG